MSNQAITVIEEFITKLRQQIQIEIQHGWHGWHGWHGLKFSNTFDLNQDFWQINLEKSSVVPVNDQNYLIFPQGRQVTWLAQQITIPQALQDYPLSGLTLRLVLTWWAEDAQIFINGELKQAGDLFDSSARILITDHAQAGQTYLIAIRLVSPNHDIGALMRSHLLYEKSYLPENVDPGLIADELTVLSRYLQQFKPEQLEILARRLAEFHWHNLNHADLFAEDLEELRSSLLPLGQDIHQRCFNLLGHAHLDMAWLWTTEETKEVAERTFKSVLSLQQNFPDLTFGHTSPALYEWIEQDNPELFQDIQNAVRSNRWELLGGMWIEPETNLVSGESLIRQLIYGQQYYQEKFGEITKVAWLPDSFGFTWQLPQIFQQCGIEYFVTGKLHWNDTTKFPHGCFWWESPDGTKLLTLMSPPNVTGVMDTNPITMINYALDWETQTGSQEMLWLPGVGDHGGGPTRDMLEVAQKWDKSSFFPQIKFTQAIDYLQKISPAANLPIWQDELYLELHRGCYTVHAEQKKYNRDCERLLYEAELWSSLATLLNQPEFLKQLSCLDLSKILPKENIASDNWSKLIEIAWKKVLFNQFHDILPGTSIPEVFIQANQDWQIAKEISENLLSAALNAIALKIELSSPPQANAQTIVIFNSLNWKRSQTVTIEAEILADQNLDFWVCDDSPDNKLIDCQQQDNQLTFLAQNVPSIGYRSYWLCWEQKSIEQKVIPNSQVNYELDNMQLKVVIDPTTGNIERIFDQINHQEILSGQGNELQFFEDQGQYWDAWNIDPEYEQKRLLEPELASIEWIEAGLTRGIRVIKKFNKSTFTQDYILESNSNILKIVNQVDWQETHVMVRAAFPFTIQSDTATYEIPCSVINRTTTPKTAAEKAQWEHSALNWVDLTDKKQNYGVSLLNDCKYGYDAKLNQLRITLLRAPTWPDPGSDRGIHHFTYAIYPHRSTWQAAKTVQKGYELNTSLKTVLLQRNHNRVINHSLPSTNQLLKFSADNIILMALKFSAENNLIMRCYEAHGESTELAISGNLQLKLGTRLDCLENFVQPHIKDNNSIQPYKIINWQLIKDE